MQKCNQMHACYLFQQDKHYDLSYDTGDKALQCGRHVDIFKLWLMWRAKVRPAEGRDPVGLVGPGRLPPRWEGFVYVGALSGFQGAVKAPSSRCPHRCGYANRVVVFVFPARARSASRPKSINAWSCRSTSTTRSKTGRVTRWSLMGR